MEGEVFNHIVFDIKENKKPRLNGVFYIYEKMAPLFGEPYRSSKPIVG